MFNVITKILLEVEHTEHLSCWLSKQLVISVDLNNRYRNIRNPPESHQMTHHLRLPRQHNLQLVVAVILIVLI